MLISLIRAVVDRKEENVYLVLSPNIFWNRGPGRAKLDWALMQGVVFSGALFSFPDNNTFVMSLMSITTLRRCYHEARVSDTTRLFTISITVATVTSINGTASARCNAIRSRPKPLSLWQPISSRVYLNCSARTTSFPASPSRP